MPEVHPSFHRRSADKLDVDAIRIFDDQVEHTGYVEDGDGDEFRYLRTAGALRRGRF